MKATNPKQQQNNDAKESIEIQQIKSNSNTERSPISNAVACNIDDGNDYNNKTNIATDTTVLKPDSGILNRLNIDIDIQLQIQHKIKFDLIHSTYCWMRICILFLVIILILLTVSYTFGGFVSVEHDLITSCEGRNLTSIWKNSLAINDNYGTHKACWSTSTTSVDLDTAFDENKYKCVDRTDNWSVPQLAVFLCFTVYCSSVLIYGIYSLIFDIIAIKQQKLYIKSSKFRNYLTHNASGAHAQTVDKVSWFGTDSKAYIALMIGAEIWEIIVQTFALLFYNGYNILDPDGIYLANRLKFIILFSCCLSFNCAVTGMLWLLYVLQHNRCNGMIFKLFTFCVDQFCDLLYIIYPIIVILGETDTRFDHGDEGVLCIVFGLLNITSWSSLVFTLFPTLFLCTKCVFMTRSAVHSMRNKSYDLWFVITKIMSTSNGKDANYIAKTLGFQLNDNVKKEIFDAYGNINITATNTSINHSNTAVSQSKCCRITLIMLATTLILYSILILGLVIPHLVKAQYFCTNAIHQSDIIANHPEFYVYDACYYKVYPFSFGGDTADVCDCRAVRIITPINFTNITSVVNGVLSEWKMLEKFILYFDSSGESPISVALTASHFEGDKMRLFHWVGLDIVSIEESISNWKQLSHFGLLSVPGLTSLPSSFGELTKLQSLHITGALYLDDDITNTLCNLNNIEVMQIDVHNIEIIPSCFLKLEKLKRMFIEKGTLKSFPLGMLNMTSLHEFSVWSNEISYETLMQLNNISTLDDPFEYISSGMKVWFHANPICTLGNNKSRPMGFQLFIESKEACTEHCVDAPVSNGCPPTALGNGVCNTECFIQECHRDSGDCVQFCFTKTSCPYEKFLNEECDEECNNKDCEWDNGYCNSSTIVS